MELVNEIIDGIGAAIRDEFGADTKVYPEELRQGFKEPCFFVKCLSQASTRKLGLKGSRARYWRESQFCVHYFPGDSHKPRDEIHGVCERLEDCLEWLTVTGDTVRGTGMRYEISEDVLLFFVNYDMFVMTEPEELTAMEELTLSQSAKEEG